MGTIKDLIATFMKTNMDLDPLLEEIRDKINLFVLEKKDIRIWKLTPNGQFSMLSFFRFLINRGQ